MEDEGTNARESSQKHYPRSPVLERAIRVEASVGEERFQECFARWREACASRLPAHTRFTEREVVVPASPGEPLVERVSIRHRFWSSPPESTHADWCIQLTPQMFIVNMRRKGREDQRGFGELREFFSRWYPTWRDCFGMPEPTVVQLEYWNSINKHTVPGSATDGYVEVKDVFTSFAATPMPPHAERYVVPYRHEANWEATLEGRSYRLSADIRTLQVKPLTVQAHFAAASGGTAAPPPDPGQDLDTLHTLLLGVFDVFFTAKAKEAFA